MSPVLAWDGSGTTAWRPRPARRHRVRAPLAQHAGDPVGRTYHEPDVLIAARIEAIAVRAQRQASHDLPIGGTNRCGGALDAAAPGFGVLANASQADVLELAVASGVDRVDRINLD